ncbi:MAG: hypothetical protein GXY41_11165 [Phycisphaerae bacterium]|nr:hypothetical protein [Phycisphaerae bacterium]
MSDRIKKFAAVVFLTLLIWAWAYLSLERQVTLWGSIELSPAAGPEFLVSFPGGNTSYPVKLTFKGPPSKVSEIERQYRAALGDPEHGMLVYYYLPQDYDHTQTGTYMLDVLDFVQNSSAYHEMALTLEASEPVRAEVSIEMLTEKQLVVQCVDEKGAPLPAADLMPGQVAMHVLPDYTGPAVIRLSPQQIAAARQGPIRQRPYVDLRPAGPRRFADDEVSIALPATEQLNPYVFQPQSIGFIFSRNTQGRFRVQIENEGDLRTVQLRATEAAYAAYQRRRHHLLIEIRDEDAALTEIPPREVIFNFPTDFVRGGQIEAASSHTAVIRLIPIAPTTSP